MNISTSLSGFRRRWYENHTWTNAAFSVSPGPFARPSLTPPLDRRGTYNVLSRLSGRSGVFYGRNEEMKALFFCVASCCLFSNPDCFLFGDCPFLSSTSLIGQIEGPGLERKPPLPPSGLGHFCSG
uniref:Uncharacterized protein n=1 Tax=Rousettus aegyptiacus TaxID=9407 RepID=A0A7J8JIG0_ROUAE|nr:hypothetical protein HJG63_010335 [Rousettus aegyptiacus]